MHWRIMQSSRFTQLLLFCVFFGGGFFAFSCAILYDELCAYYQNRHFLEEAQQHLEKLKSLNEDYDVLIEQLNNDPNMLKRVKRVTLGQGPEEEGAVFPKETPEQLEAARKALANEQAKQLGEVEIPNWLQRIEHPRRRFALLLAGCCLVIIAFIFFGPTKSIEEKSNQPPIDNREQINKNKEQM